ncbi:uncharacterized protein LOC119606164 [Lucilia sericata]|uniref:uncharacterized protein LOC119606164 n=1 Tax=Lucilia sericata TaxID=13632 RepID=UPI0018A86DBE|nr:uncharacterized protein LOC119606164 [Lucilia sericata]
MLSLLSTLLLSIVTLLAVYLYNNYTYWKRRGVCYETPLPLIGNFKGIGKTLHFKDINQRLYSRFKGQTPFCGYYLFLTKAALILDLDLIKHILIKDFANFHDRAIFNNVKDDPLTGHLLTLEGEQWRAMRTKLTPVFTSARMKYMFPTVVEVGQSFAEALNKAVEASSAQVVEIKDLCARFTTDVIGSCAFGIECHSLQDPQAEFRKKGRSIFTEPRHGPLVQTFMITNPKLARKLHMKLFTDHITDFFLNIVRQTVNYRLENNIKRNDFMDLIIELKAKNDEMAKDSKGIDLSQGLTVEQMAAQTFVFFLAGFETSSTTMSFCLYELSRNPEIQEKLRKEILETLEENKGELSYEGMNAMQYLEQVIQETLRLYPVIPNLIRQAVSDYQVPNSSYVIEKGTTISIPVAAIHYDADYYENPEKFDPSRFEPQEVEKRHPCAYLPFGDGPRNCIGSRFGKMQTKIGLISLLQRYRFECCSQTEIPLEIDKKNFLIGAKNGIQLKVIKLEKYSKQTHEMFSTFGQILFCLINILIFYLFNRYSYWKRRGVLYETPIPPFGNYLGVGTSKHVNDVIHKLYRKFKGKAAFCGVYMYLTKAAIILDVDLVKNVLIKDFGNFQDHNGFHNVEEDPLTGNLANLDGEEWHAMRSKLSAVFTSAKMKYMLPTMVAVGRNFTETLKAELACTQDQVLEIKDLCNRFTIDVIGTCAFGIECNSLKDPNAEFSVKGRKIFTEARHNLLVQIFMVCCPELARQLNMKLFTDDISNFFINIVKETVDYRLTNNIKRNDFMDLLIELKSKNDNDQMKKKAQRIDLSQGLTIEQMAAQTFVFFLGGFETSSTTISFCLYELAQHGDIQEKLRQEICTTIKASNKELTYEGINSMVYLEQVIAETLRLYPVQPNLVRSANKDYQVPNTQLIIEKGTSIIIPISAIHTDAEYYSEPMKFDPNRFLPEEIEKRHNAAYLPFSIGPRNCIGARFGKMQTKLGLISILRQYRVECCDRTEIPIIMDKQNFLISAKNGIYLKMFEVR